jgi:DNA-binding NarL/FixJ family response regulator
MGMDTNDEGQVNAKITLEEEVLLQALLQGVQDKQIAYECDLPLHVVKYRLRTLYDKMGVANRTQAALMARELII